MDPWKKKTRLGTQRLWVGSSLSMALAISLGSAQTFNSGSNGSDGAFVFNDSGTFDFNPNSFNPPLDPDGDGIFHFTTITVGPKSKLKLTARYLNGPVYWLASGAVQISGTLDLSGEDGHPQTINVGQRLPSVPGAGGFPGGIGGNTNSNSQPGAGPHGGGYRTDGLGPGAGFGGNNFCVPLVGASGGSGAWYHNIWSGSGYWYAPGGGAGGGAILIASSLSISVTGSIFANGGNGGGCCGSQNHEGGGGSGGSIRLVAPLLTGNGRIVAGYGLYRLGGNWGRVRLESFNNQYSGDFLYSRSPVQVHMPAGTVFRSHPTNTYLPSAPAPIIRVKSIAGISLPNTPTASFSVPDVAINTATSVTVEIEAKRVPPGSKPQLTIYSENGADQNFNAPDLVGNDSLSTCTIPVVFPPGYSRGYVRVSWTQ